MHATADEDNPLNSHLVFYNDTASFDDNYKLHIYEIYHQPFRAKLAVLSSCNTGFGKLARGEGVLSLARSFTYTGIDNVVMALWEVEDRTGAKIITDFYHRLSYGIPTHEAIQEAKLSYLKSSNMLFSHPYFWAAYVSVGKAVQFSPDQFEPMTEESNSFIKLLPYFAVLLAVIVLMTVLLYRKRGK